MPFDSEFFEPFAPLRIAPEVDASPRREPAPRIDDATLRVLERGRRRIARGWTQGRFVRRSGFLGLRHSYCADGAIESDPTAHAYLGAALPRDAPRFGATLIFNDARGRKQSEVVALFDRAIALRRKDLDARA